MADIKGLYIDNNTLKPSSSGGEGGSEVDFKGRTIHTLEKECMLSDFYIGSILDRDIIKENGSSYIYLNSHLIAEDLFPSYVDGYCFPKYPVEFKIFLNCLSSGTRCCSSGLCFVRNFEGDNE